MFLHIVDVLPWITFYLHIYSQNIMLNNCSSFCSDDALLGGLLWWVLGSRWCGGAMCVWLATCSSFGLCMGDWWHVFLLYLVLSVTYCEHFDLWLCMCDLWAVCRLCLCVTRCVAVGDLIMLNICKFCYFCKFPEKKIKNQTWREIYRRLCRRHIPWPGLPRSGHVSTYADGIAVGICPCHGCSKAATCPPMPTRRPSAQPWPRFPRCSWKDVDVA